MNGLEGFESVKGDGATWEPKQTGSEKAGNFAKLQPTDKSYITGVYCGSKTNVGKNDSTIHEIKVETIGDETHLQGECLNGKVNVWGTGVLDKLISENVVIGQTIAIKWLGIQTPKTQGVKPYHGWDVLVKNGVELDNSVTSAPSDDAPNTPSSVPAGAAVLDDADDDLPF